MFLLFILTLSLFLVLFNWKYSLWSGWLNTEWFIVFYTGFFAFAAEHKYFRDAMFPKTHLAKFQICVLLAPTSQLSSVVNYLRWVYTKAWWSPEVYLVKSPKNSVMRAVLLFSEKENGMQPSTVWIRHTQLQIQAWFNLTFHLMGTYGRIFQHCRIHK